MKQALVAIPGIPQSRRALNLAFNTDIVRRRNEQQPEHRRCAAHQSKKTQNTRAEFSHLRCAELAQKAGRRRGWHSAESRQSLCSLFGRPLSRCFVSTRFLAVGPLTARPAAACRDARLVGIEKLLDRVDVSAAKMKCFENGARTRAGLHEAVDDKKAPRRVVGVLRRRQTGMGQMDIGEAIIALTPGF